MLRPFSSRGLTQEEPSSSELPAHITPRRQSWIHSRTAVPVPALQLTCRLRLPSCARVSAPRSTYATERGQSASSSATSSLPARRCCAAGTGPSPAALLPPTVSPFASPACDAGTTSSSCSSRQSCSSSPPAGTRASSGGAGGAMCFEAPGRAAARPTLRGRNMVLAVRRGAASVWRRKAERRSSTSAQPAGRVQ